MGVSSEAEMRYWVLALAASGGETRRDGVQLD